MTYRFTLLACCTLVSVAIAAAPPPTEKTAPLHPEIDRLLASNANAPPASDAEFLRRIYLDLTGCIPSAAEARAFLADTAPNKRQVLIDKLLSSPEHARHLATTLDVMLMERRPDKHVPRGEWTEFLYRSALNNVPWDVLAREILSGDGSDPKSLYRVKFYLEREELNLITRDVSRLFLGMNLQCAQCHDHPRIEDYKQEDYFGLFAFLSRVSFVADANGKMNRLSEKADGDTTFQSVFDPKKVTKTALPRVPGGQAIPDPQIEKDKLYVVAPADKVAAVPTHSRRAALAGALARADYLPFRRNAANRLWAMMMGRGLIEPLDTAHLDNPPTHPELLDLLADDLAARKFKVRAFLREIALSQAYQRSSESPSENDPTKLPLYATAQLKPLTPEQLAFSLMQATGVTDGIRASLGKDASEPAVYAKLIGSVGPFINSFGSPAGMQQTFDARLDQALLLANGGSVRHWTVHGSLVANLRKLSGDALAEELYLSVLTRLPDEEERRDVADFLAKQGDVADLAWALLTSTEFRFNH